MREQHFRPTPNQVSQQQIAGQDRAQLASINHGRPTVAAMDSVNGRRYNQQGRIANGVSSGSLTAGEREIWKQPGSRTSINKSPRIAAQTGETDPG